MDPKNKRMPMPTLLIDSTMRPNQPVCSTSLKLSIVFFSRRRCCAEDALGRVASVSGEASGLHKLRHPLLRRHRRRKAVLVDVQGAKTCRLPTFGDRVNPLPRRSWMSFSRQRSALDPSFCCSAPRPLASALGMLLPPRAWRSSNKHRHARPRLRRKSHGPLGSLLQKYSLAWSRLARPPARPPHRISSWSCPPRPNPQTLEAALRQWAALLHNRSRQILSSTHTRTERASPESAA